MAGIRTPHPSQGKRALYRFGYRICARVRVSVRVRVRVRVRARVRVRVRVRARVHVAEVSCSLKPGSHTNVNPAHLIQMNQSTS